MPQAPNHSDDKSRVTQLQIPAGLTLGSDLESLLAICWLKTSVNVRLKTPRKACDHRTNNVLLILVGAYTPTLRVVKVADLSQEASNGGEHKAPSKDRDVRPKKQSKPMSI